MGNKKPTTKPAVKKFNFSKSIDRVSITLLVPQVNDDGTVEKVEVDHVFKIESLFDAMNAYRSELYVINGKGAPSIDSGAAAFALWEETISEVKNYDFEGIEDWKEFFRTNPVAKEHAVQAGNLLADQLGLLQGKLSVPFEKSGF